jgi:hypothetical protein
VIIMAIGEFVDKQYRPTMKEMFEAIGPKKELWEKLHRFVTDNYRVKQDLAFYGKNYGWAIRFRKGGKTLLSIYPANGRFTVQIIVGETHAKKASSLKLGKKVRNALENAHPFPEGRWLFIRVASRKDVTDVEKLLLLKERARTSP